MPVNMYTDYSWVNNDTEYLAFSEVDKRKLYFPSWGVGIARLEAVQVDPPWLRVGTQSGYGKNCYIHVIEPMYFNWTPTNAWKG